MDVELAVEVRDDTVDVGLKLLRMLDGAVAVHNLRLDTFQLCNNALEVGYPVKVLVGWTRE